VLWLKELGLLFGNTAYASAATLGAFFTGLAAGSYYWGRKSKTGIHSLRLYAFLELGIACSSLLFFILSNIYYAVYTPLFTLFGHSILLFTNIKFILSVGILFIPCFFMGGTFPVIADAFIHHADNLGRKASLLYAINTLGAATGAFITSFYLILHLGVKFTYAIAIIINLVIALSFFILSSSQSLEKKVAPEPGENTGEGLEHNPLPKQWILLIAFLSGFLTLCLEVLWIRMFALVLHNSVYSFAVILITFISALALGSFLSNRLCRLKIPTLVILCLLLILSGISAGISPSVFYRITNGLAYTAKKAGWGSYILTIFSNAVLVVMVPGIFAGAIFPFLMKISQSAFKENAGSILGNLSCLNTIGAALGSVVSGFILLHVLGLWKSILVIAMVYLTIPFILSIFMLKKTIWLHIAPVILTLILLTFLNPVKFPILKIEEGEELLEIWEGSYGSVAAVKGGENLSLALDNYYTLGDLSALDYERMQAHLPLVLHPKPDSVLLIGMGTGITAGSSLLHPVSSVTSCELIPEVISAAEKYFTPYVHGLFTNPASRIITEDGRNFLLGTRSNYDVIISDLFVPWSAGTGSLYTLEHYKTIFARLKKNGLFAQWLPLFQLSQQEFMIITRTMLEVFPQITLWRGDFFSHGSIVALIGHKELMPLEPSTVAGRMKDIPLYTSKSDELVKAMLLIFYAGNISENREVFNKMRINTDNRPLIEYLSPLTHRMEEVKKVSWFELYELLNFYEDLFNRVPPDTDPFLKLLDGDDIDAVKAGLMYFKGAVLEEDKKPEEAETWYKKFFAHFPPELAHELENTGFQFIGE